MRTVILYIGMSLDGYIARPNGSVDWMHGQEEAAEFSDSYSELIREADTVIMGWNTYHQVTTQLSPGAWPYAGMTTYVLTHRGGVSSQEIRFTPEHPRALIGALRQQLGGAIWICGGADVVRQLMQADLIDRFHISILPTLLGEGIPLFARPGQERRLRLLQTRAQDGIVELIYERRPLPLRPTAGPGD